MSIEKKKRAPGAGVKAKDGVVAPPREQVRLDPSTKEIMRKVGKGNVSLGIREAARRLVEHGDVAPFDLNRHLIRRLTREKGNESS